PARRDGTPEKKKRDSEILLSNAKPARRQNVKRNKKATAQSVASDLGADWLYEDASSAPNPAQKANAYKKYSLRLVLLPAVTQRYSSTLVELKLTAKSSSGKASA